MAEGRGEQIVEVVRGMDGRSWYQLDVEALERLLLHPAVADRPVAVVSVAGACRGGKSFMLDYFLRYLCADERARADGSWLGAPTEPLVGFTWRGGAERATTGLLLWSGPLPATATTGEPVVALLMDTQGTFDTQTTVRDSSTIFALSTLLSCVQIYNLKEDIREDNLQHLQLFTAHGRMALDLNTGRKPYQTLKFLVRDWSSDYEIPYGSDGGRTLLKRRLQLDNRAGELHDVREHIYTCFETVDCFLMPHPGLPVHRQAFDGRHSDVSEDFRKQLLQFVPSVFEPKNLPLKFINGAPVTGRELFIYFRTYVDLFNSGNLPEPMSIMRATSEAALLTAMEAARRQYHEAMEESCGVGRRGRLPAAVRTCHEAASDAALETFRARRTMANPQDVLEREAQLTQMLEDRLPGYQAINEANNLKALTDAKQVYEEIIESEIGDMQLCLNPQDLEEIHAKAAVAAVKLYDSRRFKPEGVTDDERDSFVTRLTERLRQLIQLNEVSNNAAVAEAREDYANYMDSMCGDPPCARVLDVRTWHQEARERALDIFSSKRNRPTQHERDPFKSQLSKDIDQKFTRLQNLNENNNNSAVDASITKYNNHMGTVCAPHLPCVEQDHLNQTHEEALELALNEFHSKRRPGEDTDEGDVHRVRIIEEVWRRYQELCELNELASGLAAYCNSMQATCGAGRPRLSADALDAAHDYALNLALNIYQQNRQGRLRGNNSNDDRQRETLVQQINERYEQCRLVNDRNPAAPLDDMMPAEDGRDIAQTALVAAGAAMLVGAAVATVVASGGAGAAVLGAAGGAATAETIMSAAATAAGIAATSAAATWNFIRAYYRR